MKLISTHLQNFRLHRDTNIIWPPEGMTGIIGMNESGKTTIPEAIRWAFFGSKALRKTVKSLRWILAPARNLASVNQTFEVGGKQYDIERTERNATLYEVQPGPAGAPSEKTRQPIAKGIDAVDDYMPGLLGLDLQEFDATYMCGQKDIGRLVTMKGTARKQFILKVLGVGRIDDALASCRRVKNELKSEVEGMAAGLGDRPIQAAEDASTDLTDAEALQVDAAAQADVATGLLKTAEGAFERVERAKARFDELTNQIATEQRLGNQAHDDLKDINIELETVKKAKEFVAESEPELARLKELEAELDSMKAAQQAKQEVDRITSEIEQLGLRRAGLDRTIAEHKETVDAFDQGVLDSAAAALDHTHQLSTKDRDELQLLDYQCSEAQESLNKLREAGPDGACPTCNRELGSAYDFLIKSSEEHLAAVASSTESMKIVVEAWKKKLIAAQQAAVAETTKELQSRAASETLCSLRPQRDQMQQDIHDRQATLANLPDDVYDPEKYEELHSEVVLLEELAAELAVKKATAEREPDLIAKGQKKKEEGEAIFAKKSQLEAEQVALDFDPADWKVLREQLDGKRLHNSEEERRLAAAVQKVEGCQHAAAAAQRTLIDYDARAGELQVKQINLDNHVRADVRLAEFRTAMAASIRPELEELTSGFVEILTDGRHEAVVLSDEFDITLMEGGVPSEVISGGTEDIAALALRLSISQMIAQRAGHPLSLMILDEPFGSLDEVRRGNVLGLLDRLKKTFEQVVVSTHVDDVKDSVDALFVCEYDPDTQQTVVTT